MTMADFRKHGVDISPSDPHDDPWPVQLWCQEVTYLSQEQRIFSYDPAFFPAMPMVFIMFS